MRGKDDLRRIAKELLILAAQNDDSDDNLSSATRYVPPYNINPDHVTRFAQSLYKSRRARARYFDKNLFGEPIWDMLLDIFVHQSSGLPVLVKTLCLASDVPETTALRYIALLVETGLIARKNDERDRRRTFLSLTPSGEAAIRQCLIEMFGLIRAPAVSGFMLVDNSV